jgi:hypothetical protein
VQADLRFIERAGSNAFSAVWSIGRLCARFLAPLPTYAQELLLATEADASVRQSNSFEARATALIRNSIRQKFVGELAGSQGGWIDWITAGASQESECRRLDNCAKACFLNEGRHISLIALSFRNFSHRSSSQLARL